MDKKHRKSHRLSAFIQKGRHFLATLFCVLSSFHLGTPAYGSTSHYLVDGHIVLDLRSGVEWLRCSLGQVYNNGMCEGEIIRLEHAEIKQAIELANKELGGRWRLPTKDELELLVCASCEPPRIEKTIFPQTASEPYWTGQKNWLSSKNFWSVNFMTGYSYSRFFPDKPLAVRLVRDRNKIK